MAVLRDNTNPLLGPSFRTMITSKPGDAAELFDDRAGEITVIPTYGVSANGLMILHYMAVTDWNDNVRASTTCDLSQNH